LTECGGLGGCAGIILGKISATLIGTVVSRASQTAKRSKFSGASHSVSVSRPKDVAAVIQEAASNARWKGMLRWPFENLNVKGVRHSSGVRPVWRMSGPARDFPGSCAKAEAGTLEDGLDHTTLYS
jgi:hypothetical protein